MVLVSAIEDKRFKIGNLAKIPGFTTFGRKNAMRPKKLMDTPEPLILEYKLERWMSPTYRGNDPQQICVPKLKATYTGLIRIGNEDEAAMPVASVQADDLVKQALAETGGETCGEDKAT